LLLIAGSVLLILFSQTAFPADSTVTQATEGWHSERIFGLPGLQNVGIVAPGIYRGAQPEEDGYATLKAMGIKTVISLRAFHGERVKVEAAGMKSIEIPINILRSVKPEQIEQAVAAMADPKNQPVYVHCALGEDRTGTVVAVYRMTKQGWPYKAAIDEMQAFGFNDIWIQLKEYLEKFDQDHASSEKD